MRSARASLTDAQRALVVAHGGLAGAVAWPFARRALAHPGGPDAADLLQAGLVGLCQAAARWHHDRGVPFEAYARRRIRGALIDTIRADRAASGVARGHRTAAIVTQWPDGYDPPARSVDVTAAIDAAAILATVPDARQRFALRTWTAGYSHRAIGAAMDRSESRAKQLYWDGIAIARRTIAR